MVRFLTGASDLRFLQNVQIGSGLHPLDTGVNSTGVKRPDLEAEQLGLSSAEVKNE